MEKIFKRSFIGYSPRIVDKTINAVHGDFEKQLRDLESQYTQEENEIQLLKEKIKELKDVVTSFQSLEAELSQILVSAHLNACEKILEATNNAVQIEESVFNKVSEYEKETAILIKTRKDITHEIDYLTRRYRTYLEGSDDE